MQENQVQMQIEKLELNLFYNLFCSIIVTSKQFFGDPIECDAGHASGMIDKDVLG
jgi:hypothetical protein